MSPGSRSRNAPLGLMRLAHRKGNLLLRARMVQSVRAFFIDRGYLEVDTPQLISAPAPEAHIDAIGAGDRYLQTSPELCMKRLLASGFSKIFQVSRSFRGGERGDLHLPEFSLLEWYRVGLEYHALMDECEDLILFLSESLGKGEKIVYGGHGIDLKRPWEWLSVRTAFERYASTSMSRALETGCFDEVMVKEIEPHLGMVRPTFLYDYPAALAALARLKPNGETVAERFEFYMAGMELANGFSELNDPIEQRARFERERQMREDMARETYPMPERFLMALGHMPDAAGIALGVDRLAMIFTNAHKIDDVVSFTPEEV